MVGEDKNNEKHGFAAEAILLLIGYLMASLSHLEALYPWFNIMQMR